MRKLAVLMMAGALSGCAILPKLHVGAGVSAVIPEDSDTFETTIQGDVCVRVTAAMLQVEGSVGVKTYEYTVEEGGTVLEEGELDQIPVALVVKYAVGAGPLAVVIGGGLVWNVNDEDDIQSLTVEDSLGYKVVLGVNLRLPMDFALSIEGQYDFNDADIEAAIGSIFEGKEVDTSGFVARVALLYNF